MVYAEVTAGQADLHILSLEGDFSSQPLLQTEFIEWQSRMSPDGHWITYESNETGRNEIYVRPFPNVDGGGKWQISRDGGREPRWGSQGRELFYRSLNGANYQQGIWAVSIEGKNAIVAGDPELLVPGNFLYGGRPSWDISPDGQRFLMLQAVGQSAPEVGQTSIVFVDNWFEELNRLAPPSP